MAERFPRGALTVPLTPDAIFLLATVPPPDPTWMQPTIRGPMPVPSLQEQVLPMPCTLPTTWEPLMEPFQDAVLLSEDQGHPAPTDVCPHPATALLTCSTATLQSRDARTGADPADGFADVDDLLTWINEGATASTDIPDDNVEMGHVLTGISEEELSTLEVPQENQDLPVVPREETRDAATVQEENLGNQLLPELDGREQEELRRWIAATEPPSPDVPSSLDSSPFIAELPDFPRSSRELSKETQAAATLSDPFWGQPASPGQLSELLPRSPFLLAPITPPHLSLLSSLAAPTPPSPCTAHLLEEVRRRQPRVVLSRLALPAGCVSCRVADQQHRDGTEPAKHRVPPLVHTGQLVEEARQKQPRVVLSRLALPAGCISCRVASTQHGDGTEPAKRPTPACASTKGKSSRRKQHAGSIPARKRKLPPCQGVPAHQQPR
ncbi:uncharacterized protein LOC125685370 [Lagopus muta]|uniref:uncharacterized protein LOC125685366 n=1 Tax=Lagopus muta TaxID=64668 RepID=UPI0020A0C61E|nr:uncharacterized protein LOC125685366 [Lagopus muta]XP_048784320.1 uncharacterized protein LOC125685368 [Lagopus muta]XP_048784321.1 uncharacterized protein LOC125685370 [Lagopus muta]